MLLFQQLMLALVRLYRHFLSPLTLASRRYTPTCSAYAAETIARCHLLVDDHFQAFYDLQARLMPDWERWKKELNALPR